MRYLFLHQNEISLMALSLCVLLFCIFIQWGMGLRPTTWVLRGIALGALILVLGSFFPIHHAENNGSAYALLVGVLSVMIPALSKLAPKAGEPSAN